MAEGGHGAPLVPLADYILFRQQAPCTVHNIGGISNLTVVTKRRNEVYAFDTGPGCALMDESVKLLFRKQFDRQGWIARRGTPDRLLLKRLLADAYFKVHPPKSTGREHFGSGMALEILKKYTITPEDAVSTFTYLTAESIAMAYKKFVFPKMKIKEIILTGGGSKNSYLRELIMEALSPVPVRLIDDYGIPSGAKEAVSFALLANETLSGHPGNLPRATGARKAVVLGSVTRP